MEQNNSLPEERIQSVKLVELARIVAKRTKLICLFIAAAAVVSLAYSLSLPNIYTAKTMILPNPEVKGLKSAMLGQLGGLENLVGDVVGGNSTSDLYASMLRSETVKDRIIARFKLLDVYNKRYRAEAYRLMDRKVLVSTGKKDGIITLSVDDRDPKRAADMANSYVEELERLAVRLNVTGAGENRTFLEARLARAKGDLAKAEDDLKVFQGKYKAVNVTEQSKATIEGVAQLRAKLAVYEVELATLRRQYTETNQDVKNLSTTVASLRSQIAKLEGANVGGAIPSVGSMPALGEEYGRRMREFKIQESLVEMLTKQYEMARLNEAKDIAPFQVIQKADIPEIKSKPSRFRIVLLSTVVTFFLAILFTLVLENIERMSEDERKQWLELRNYLLFWKKA